jgi:multiple sugar transport system permease protein
VTPRERLGHAFVYLALAVAILLALFPFWWMLTTSFKRPIDIFSGVELWPQQITFDNYDRLFNNYHFGYFLLNSVVVVTAAVTVSLILGTLAAYALARFRLQFGVRKMALYLVLLVRMLPGIMLCSLYIVLAASGFQHAALADPGGAGLSTSFVIWMMRGFLRNSAHRGAAKSTGVAADGAARSADPWRLDGRRRSSGVIPHTDSSLRDPASTRRRQAVPVRVSTPSEIEIQWGPIAAAGVIGALPIVIFALIVQRNFVRGLTLGAVK